MGEEGDFWRDCREKRKKERRGLGIPCPQCNVFQPKRNPTILMPGQKCRVCGYVDPRKEK